MVRNPPANEEDADLIPGLGRSPGGGNGNPLQYSCLENSMDCSKPGFPVFHGLLEFSWKANIENLFLVTQCQLIKVLVKDFEIDQKLSFH